MADTAEAAAPSKAQAQENQIFRFEDLPDELQVKIIEFAVIEDQPIKTTVLGEWRCSPGQNYNCISDERAQPSVSKVNRKLRVEALKAYYGLNEFNATYCMMHEGEDDAHPLILWLEGIGSSNRQLIRNLVIAEGTSTVMARGTCLQEFETYSGFIALEASMMAPRGEYFEVSMTFPG